MDFCSRLYVLKVSKRETTISAHIEHHSLLERQEGLFGHTMGFFKNFSSKNAVILEKKMAKNDHNVLLKKPNFDRIPAFYMRG